MREGGSADLAFVWLVGAVGDEIDAEFAFGRFDRGIDFAGRDAVPFGIELEVFDDSFHRTFHFAPSRRNDLVIAGGNEPLAVGLAKLFDALFHDTHRLTHLLHAHEVAIIAVAMLANRDVTSELGVAFRRLYLAPV